MSESSWRAFLPIKPFLFLTSFCFWIPLLDLSDLFWSAWGWRKSTEVLVPRLHLSTGPVRGLSVFCSWGWSLLGTWIPALWWTTLWLQPSPCTVTGALDKWLPTTFMGTPCRRLPGQASWHSQLWPLLGFATSITTMSASAERLPCCGSSDLGAALWLCASLPLLYQCRSPRSEGGWRISPLVGRMSSNYMVIFRIYLLRKRFEELGSTIRESVFHTPLSVGTSSQPRGETEHFMSSCCLWPPFLKESQLIAVRIRASLQPGGRPVPSWVRLCMKLESIPFGTSHSCSGDTSSVDGSASREHLIRRCSQWLICLSLRKEVEESWI